jgi:hypothetical protein
MIGPTEFLLVTFLAVAVLGIVGTALFLIVKLVKWIGRRNV